MTPPTEENLINQLNTIVSSIKSINSRLTDDDITKAVGYNEGFISQARSRGKVSKKFINVLNKYYESLQNTNTVKMETKGKEPLETAIENLSISKVIDSRNMERLILLLQAKLGILPDMPGFSQPGTKGTETGTKKANSGAK